MDNNNQPITKRDLVEIIKPLDQKISGLDQKISGLDQKINGLDQKLDQKFNVMDVKMNRLYKSFLRLDIKVDKFTDKILEKSAKDKNKILKSNDELVKKLIKHDQERVMLGKKVNDYQEKIEKFMPKNENTGTIFADLELQPA